MAYTDEVFSLSGLGQGGRAVQGARCWSERVWVQSACDTECPCCAVEAADEDHPQLLCSFLQYLAVGLDQECDRTHATGIERLKPWSTDWHIYVHISTMLLSRAAMLSWWLLTALA